MTAIEAASSPIGLMMEEEDNGLTGITTHYGNDGSPELPHRITVKYNGVTKSTGFYKKYEVATQEIRDWRLAGKIIQAMKWATE
jgi:hypothetical protein